LDESDFRKDILKIMSKVSTFLRDVRAELAKVSWPGRSQTIRFTLIVVGLSLALAIYLGALDFLFGFLLQKFII